MAPKRKARRKFSDDSTIVDSSTSRESDEKREALRQQAEEAIKEIHAIKDAKIKELKSAHELFLFSTPAEILEMSMEGINSKEDFLERVTVVMNALAEKENSKIVNKTNRRRRSRSLQNGDAHASGSQRRKRNSSSAGHNQQELDSTWDISESRDEFFCSGQNTVKKRRSRSLGIGSVERQAKIMKRSISAHQFQTPQSRELAKRLMSHKKYTVRKPIKMAESAVNVKRVMRAGEEAISVSGSPLFIQSGSSVTEPQVTIPLPGGVIINIEPNKVWRNNMPKLPIDPQVREQIKKLQENLGKLMSR